MWTCEVQALTPTTLTSALGLQSHANNSYKLDHWAATVRDAADGEQIMLMDADMAILRPLDEVWAQEFDLAYTVRDPKYTRFPFNGGVVCVRVSDRTKRFVAEWRTENFAMLTNAPMHRPGRIKYGGINQASFGTLIHDRGRLPLKVAKLPCLEWNCEDSSWERFDPALTRVLHLKGHLRRAVFGQDTAVKPGVKRLVALWHSLEAQATMRARSA